MPACGRPATPNTLKSLVIVDTGPDTQRRGQDRMRRFRELPDELDTFEEFVRRVQEYTGRSEEQTLGALKYSIRQRADGKWTWKYDKAMRAHGGPSAWLDAGPAMGLRRPGIDCPTLVLRGDRSDLFSEETMLRMKDVIPDCSTATIPNAGHLVQGDNPARFIAEVETFLGRVLST